MRDFESINRFFGDREIDELQAAIDARREARALRSDDPLRRGSDDAARAGVARPKHGRPAGRSVTFSAPLRVQSCEGDPTEEGEERVSKRSSRDKAEGAMDKVTGRVKEAGGSLTGDEGRKAEGRADRDKGTLKKKKGAAKDLLK